MTSSREREREGERGGEREGGGGRERGEQLNGAKITDGRRSRSRRRWSRSRRASVLSEMTDRTKQRLGNEIPVGKLGPKPEPTFSQLADVADLNNNFINSITSNSL